MRRFHRFTRIAICLLAAAATTAWADHHETGEHDEDEGWISLFNGEDLTGWEITKENPETFSVVDGLLVVKGPRAHAFYAGEVNEANFKNFEWKCEIMTKPGANSGMYFHTKYQEAGWPSIGYEVQVNNTHGDPKKTGGLYGIDDVLDESPAEDNEWFTQTVTVRGKRIIVKVNGEVTTDYTEPEDVEREEAYEGRLLSEGTIAIQGHDPDSEIHYRKIMIRPLPDDVTEHDEAEEKKEKKFRRLGSAE